MKRECADSCRSGSPAVADRAYTHGARPNALREKVTQVARAASRQATRSSGVPVVVYPAA
ncbi:hypothetical protein NWFMUON74_22660 [Nocardia wallacei]|uniref:Uncharacterized protein n=1 Tax=Nocardia wallacei TaxID=480035 RepID=A0A7G1KMF2_9NOCA|nr:hypothetical protein NWFMUON74_22660 [Nocardia wallacei]